MSTIETRQAAALLRQVCDPRQPDWKTSRADARTALSLACGVPADEIDSLGYDRTERSYREVRDSWVHYVSQFGYNELLFKDDIAEVQADWAEYRPGLAAGDDWLAAGRARHLAAYPEGPCQSAIRGGCTLHEDITELLS